MKNKPHTHTLMKPHTLLGSWRRILGRPRWWCPLDTSHSRSRGRAGVWTLCRCSWHHTGWSGQERHMNIHHTLMQKSVDRFRVFPTTLGMNGGLSFWARRSSQLMGAKKECSCSSAWTHTEISPAGVCCIWYASLLAVDSQGHGSLPNAWRRIFPTVPARATGQPGSPHRAAARGREGFSQTSLTCFGCKMEAVIGSSKTGKGEDAAGGDGE